MRKHFAILIILLSVFGGSCNQREPKIPTVDGPEAIHLVSQSQGYLIHAVNAHAGVPPGIKIISLPDANERIIKVPVPPKGYYHINQLTGPDQEGRIFYTISKENQRKYDLFMTNLEGEKNEIFFSEDYSKEWNRRFGLERGHTLILSPKGGHLVVIKDLGEGMLEIWNIENKTLVTAFPGSGYSSASWFPDGVRLAYTRDIDYRAVPGFDTYPESLQKIYREYYKYSWPMVEAVFIYNLSTQNHTFFHIGYRPVVSLDGVSILINDIEKNSYRIDVENKKSVQVDWPGRIRSAFAFVSQDRILYRGLPTTGMRPKTVVNSPLLGRKLMPPIKIADLLTGEFQTVIESLHPYDDISYGQSKS